jgi:hypothetical protein
MVKEQSFRLYTYADLAMGVAYWYTKNDKNVIHKAPSDAKVGLVRFSLSINHIIHLTPGWRTRNYPCALFCMVQLCLARKPFKFILVSEFKCDGSGKATRSLYGFTRGSTCLQSGFQKQQDSMSEVCNNRRHEYANHKRD